MSEELLQRNLIKSPEKIGNWNFYNIGATTLNVLKKYNVIADIDYKGISKRKPDGLIASDKKVVAVIANKLPSKLRTKKQIEKEISDWVSVTKSLNSKLLIVTDTEKTIWVNALSGEVILDEKGNQLNTVFDPKGESLAKLIEKILLSIDETNNQIIPLKLKDPSPLARQIWQDVWSVSGASAENCLYTFVELFIFKYLSDLNVLTGFYNFYDLLKKYETNTNEEVLEFYAEIIRKEIKNKFKENPKDKTTIINGTIFVSKDNQAVKGYSTVFKKVLEKFRDEGKLENIHHDFKSKIFESFLKESISKKNWGQFFTPLKVVRAIVDMVEIKEGMKICDPACGVGKFLLEPILKDTHRFYKVDSKRKIVRNIELYGFDKGFDKDEQKTIILAKANMLIYLSDLIKENPDTTQQFSDLFNDTFLLQTNSILGTLTETVKDEYDLILTNPPYVTAGSSNIKEEITKSGLDTHYPVNATGVEGLFFEWIIKALKPGGTAVVVIPDGILSRNNDKILRNYLMKECVINSIISLPEKTFFTTLKKTYIISFTKKTDTTKKQTEPIFSYLASSIGETLDVNRIEIPEDNDLEEATILYNQFKGSKKHFKSSSKRCKAISFKWFEDNSDKSWIIENLWDEKDLITFGIKKEERKINVNDFSIYLDNLTISINDYQQQLNEVISKQYDFKPVSITDDKLFSIITGALGLKKKQYALLDTKSESDIPVFTATLKPVAYFKKDSTKRIPQAASEKDKHISFGSDGEGTAGTNIVLHDKPYFINTSRTAMKIIDKNIYPEYVFFCLQGMKRKYGFDFKHKATLNNLGKVIINIPIDENGQFDLEAQKAIYDKYNTIYSLKNELRNKLNELVETEIDVQS